MLKTLQNAFRVKEVRQKLVYTFMMLIVFRIGSQMPIPGANTSFFDELFARYNNDAFGFLNSITGGSLTNMSVFALSITPYITSSIIMQLLTIAIPKLEEMQRDGEEGRKKIQEYTRYLTVGLALMQSAAMAIGFGGQGLLLDFTALNVIVTVATMTAGSAVLMWIGERITENGVGNGISIVLLFNSKRHDFSLREIHAGKTCRRSGVISGYHCCGYRSYRSICYHSSGRTESDSGTVF